MPIVIRIPYAGGVGAVEHHSDSSEAYYAHTPGLKVVTPATVVDAYSLLREAIEDPDPVIFFEPKKLYWSKQEVSLPVRTEVFGQSVIRRAGTDVTLIAYGASVPVALAAAEAASEEGHHVEVIDLRTLTPLDNATIYTSVRRTGRCVIIHESPGFVGVGAEIAARIQERCFHSLHAPVLRVTGFDTPYPPPKLERHYLPNVQRVLNAIDRLQWHDEPDPQWLVEGPEAPGEKRDDASEHYQVPIESEYTPSVLTGSGPIDYSTIDGREKRYIPRKNSAQ
jgi:2-oxoisovalerate dehydrogenase E1 component beta subunit